MARKVASVLVALCLSVVVSLAGEKHGRMDAAGHAAKLKAELNLNTEQAAQVESIFADISKRMQPIQTRRGGTHDELKALRSAGDSDAAAIMAKEGELKAIGSERHALFAERDTALEGILTAEQFAKFQELAAAHAEKGMHGGHGGGGHGGGGHGGGGHAK